MRENSGVGNDTHDQHHCRLCNGLFGKSCALMVLPGQGDTPVYICQPCKKLEEAAHFELQQRCRAGRGDGRKSLEATMALMREISSIIEDIQAVSSEENGSRTDKTHVVALKKRALALKREGKHAEAKEELKRAKVLEKQLKTEDSDDEAPKSRSTILNKIRSLNREAIAFRREQKLDEAVEALRKCQALEVELELMWMFKAQSPNEEVEEPVKKAANSSVLDSSGISSNASRSKGETQKEILATKRKAFALNREGKVEEAAEVSSMTLRAKIEARIKEREKQMRELPLYVSNHEKPDFPASTDLYGKCKSPGTAVEADNDSPSSVCGPLSEEDGPSNENVGHNTSAEHFMISSDLSSCDSLESIGMFAEKLRQSICSLLGSSGISSEASRNKREIEDGILALKRKAIALKRKGKNEKALDVWGFATHLQAIM